MEERHTKSEIDLLSGRPRPCPGQQIRYPPQPSLPYDWLKSELREGYLLTDIDGYTVNFQRKMVTAFLQRREYILDQYTDLTFKKGLLDYLHKPCEALEWRGRLDLAEALGVPLYFIVWPKDYPAKSYALEQPVLFYKLSDLSRFDISLGQRGTANDLGIFIKNLRGSSFSTVKPLRIANTLMECYLSRTPNPWPGNLDGILFKDGQVIAILEFKAHNLDTPIQEEDRSKYESADLRRFSVLSIIQENIKKTKGLRPKLVLIIWGTKSIHKKVKIQIIEKKVVDETYINSPIFSGSTSRQFTNEFLAYLDCSR